MLGGNTDYLVIGFLCRCRLPRNNPGGSTNTLRFGGRCETRGYESDLEAPSNNKICKHASRRIPRTFYHGPGPFDYFEVNDGATFLVPILQENSQNPALKDFQEVF